MAPNSRSLQHQYQGSAGLAFIKLQTDIVRDGVKFTGLDICVF
jgi:hypothetical protein